MKCDPTLYRGAPPSLAVKPRLLRHWLLPPLIILLTDRPRVRGLSRQRAFRYPRPSAKTANASWSCTPAPSKVNSANTPTCPACWSWSPASRSCWPTRICRTGNTVNQYLEGLNRRSRSRAIYVLDTTGRVLATSNWRDADSYLGEDLSFRAYFQDAVRGQPGRFYGIGSTSGEPGYYLAHGLEEQGKIIGVAVIKVRLEALEERWQRARLEAYVSDENGIIILSSDPTRRLKSVRPLSADTKEKLARSLQYYWWPLNELQPLQREQLAEGVEKVTFATNSEVITDHQQVSYLAQTRNLNDTPWDITLLTPLQDLRREAANQGMLVAVALPCWPSC
jgi:two-component system, sensor histidine kinase AauS